MSSSFGSVGGGRGSAAPRMMYTNEASGDKRSCPRKRGTERVFSPGGPRTIAVIASAISACRLTKGKRGTYQSAWALVAELVDAQVSGTCGESRGGSSPLQGTIFLILANFFNWLDRWRRLAPPRGPVNRLKGSGASGVRLPASSRAAPTIRAPVDAAPLLRRSPVTRDPRDKRAGGRAAPARRLGCSLRSRRRSEGAERPLMTVFRIAAPCALIRAKRIDIPPRRPSGAGRPRGVCRGGDAGEGAHAAFAGVAVHRFADVASLSVLNVRPHSAGAIVAVASIAVQFEPRSPSRGGGVGDRVRSRSFIMGEPVPRDRYLRHLAGEPMEAFARAPRT